MEWIKRNLLFVIGSVVSLVLMVLAALYLMSGMGKNDAALEKLNQEYEQLKRLNSQSPHPGDEETDNIAAAIQQKKEVDVVIERAQKVFVPINPIPPGTNINSAAFAGALRRTIDKLQQDAARGGVQLPTNFYFSFTAVQNRIMFDQAGLQPLAAQLGDVKAVCDVLMSARINALDAVRRPRVSTHDLEAQQTADYTSEAAVTNDIAVLAPYEVTFRCFSAELAEVLSGYATSPHGLIVRAINVEPVTASGSPYGEYGDLGAGYPAAYPPTGFEGAVPPAAYPPTTYVQPAAEFAPPGALGYAGAEGGLEGNRYGGGATAGNRYQDNNRYATGGGFEGGSVAGYGTPGGATYGTPAYGTPTYGTPAYGYATPRARTSSRGGLPTLLDEKQFKVTLLVQVVRLNPEPTVNQ